jgi:hypothetical protein
MTVDMFSVGGESRVVTYLIVWMENAFAEERGLCYMIILSMIS